MRIISNFHDYYDCIQKFGQDSHFQYLRFRKEVSLNFSFYREHKFKFCNYGTPNTCVFSGMSCNIIGFCGKLYPCIRVTEPSLGYYTQGFPISGTKEEEKRHTHFLYSLDSVDCYVREKLGTKEQELFFSKGRKYKFRFTDEPSRYNLERAFEQFSSIEGKFAHLFEDNLCAQFVIPVHGRNKPETIIYHAQLSTFNFQKIFEPYKAYQEVSMYMGNLAHPDKPIPHNLTDKEFAEIKGFNAESFRKPKSKKK